MTSTARLPTLHARVRSSSGTHMSRAIRGAGMIPSIIHSRRPTEKPLLLSLDHKDFTKYLRSPSFFNTVFDVDVEDRGVFRVIPRVHQRHYIYSDKTVNITFLKFEPFKRHSVDVPIIIDHADQCKGSKRGGFLLQSQYSLPCYWNGDENIPRSIRIDARVLDIGDTAHSRNVYIPEGLTLQHPHHQYAFASVLGSKGAAEVPST